MLDLQKASLLKRISAALFDFIILIIAITGFALALNPILGYDAKLAQYEAIRDQYEAEYNVKFDLSQAELQAMDETERAHYDEVQKIINQDNEFINAYSLVINLSFIMVIFSIFLGFLLVEFAVPLLFKNGQTMGKKIFSVALMREDGVRITPVMLFIRTVLGKFTIETMIPIFIFLMILFGKTGLIGLIIIAAIWLTQIVAVFASKNRTAIHDKMAATVAVDMQSQLIFNTPEELLAYKSKLHKEKVEQTES